MHMIQLFIGGLWLLSLLSSLFPPVSTRHHSSKWYIWLINSHAVSLQENYDSPCDKCKKKKKRFVPGINIFSNLHSWILLFLVVFMFQEAILFSNHQFNLHSIYSSQVYFKGFQTSGITFCLLLFLFKKKLYLTWILSSKASYSEHTSNCLQWILHILLLLFWGVSIIKKILVKMQNNTYYHV